MRPMLILSSALFLSSALAAAPTVSNVRFSTSKTGGAMKSFTDTTAKIFLLCNIKGVSGAQAQAVWIAEKVNKGVPANFTIDNAGVTLPVTSNKMFVNIINFSLSKPTTGWPKGLYRVEVYVAATKDGVLPDKPTAVARFTVK